MIHLLDTKLNKCLSNVIKNMQHVFPKLILIFPVTKLASSEHNSNFTVVAMLISPHKNLQDHLKLHMFKNLYFFCPEQPHSKLVSNSYHLPFKSEKSWIQNSE